MRNAGLRRRLVHLQATAEQLQRLQKAQQQAAAAAAAAASSSGLVATRQPLVPARVSAVAVTSAAGTIVSVSNLTSAQVQVAQRFVSGGLVASSAATKAGIATSIPIQTLTQKSLTPSQLQALKQQTMLRQKLTTLEPLKRLQVATTASAAGVSAGASGSAAGTSAGLTTAGVAAGGAGTSQKVQVAVTSLGTSLGTVTGMAAVPVTQAQARTQVRILKQAAGKQMVAARTMTESEMAAILKQKPQLSHQMQPAQLMPQFLAQVQSAAAARGAGGSSSPATSGATQTVTIPVTAISMAGVTLPHMRAGTPAKVGTLRDVL